MEGTPTSYVLRAILRDGDRKKIGEVIKAVEALNKKQAISKLQRLYGHRLTGIIVEAETPIDVLQAEEE